MQRKTGEDWSVLHSGLACGFGALALFLAVVLPKERDDREAYLNFDDGYLELEGVFLLGLIALSILIAGPLVAWYVLRLGGHRKALLTAAIAGPLGILLWLAYNQFGPAASPIGTAIVPFVAGTAARVIAAWRKPTPPATPSG